MGEPNAGREPGEFFGRIPRKPRWLQWALLLLAVALLGSLALIAGIQLVAPPSTSGASATSTPCSPKPCVDLQGYTLWVSDVTEDNGLLRMQVTFRNASNSTHAAPEDLSLLDSSGATSPSIQDPPGCTHWARTEFNNGAKFGPITVCFQPASLDPPLRLRWTPDMGFFCCQADVRVK